jgi:hypothetical protein
MAVLTYSTCTVYCLQYTYTNLCLEIHIFAFNCLKSIHSIFLHVHNFCALFSDFETELVMVIRRKKLMISDQLNVTGEAEVHLINSVRYISVML